MGRSGTAPGAYSPPAIPDLCTRTQYRVKVVGYDMATVLTESRDVQGRFVYFFFFREACDCSILYWYRSLISIYFKNIFKSPELMHSLRFVLTALHDPTPTLLKAEHLPDRQLLLQSWVKESKDHFDAEVLKPLKKEIEDDLRLHIHSVVLGQDSRDLKQLPTVRDFSRFTKHPTLHFFGEIFSIRCVPVTASHTSSAGTDRHEPLGKRFHEHGKTVG